MFTDLKTELWTVPLLDHHVHSVLATQQTPEQFELLITESDRPAPRETTQFDSQIGLAIRRHCPPVLGLPAHVDHDKYLAARARRTPRELAGLFLGAANVGSWYIDTGFKSDELLNLDQLGQLDVGSVREVVRLETILEQVAHTSTAEDLQESFLRELRTAAETAVGIKSIVAYRYGFDFDPTRPTLPEVRSAAGRWLRSAGTNSPLRVHDPVLLRMALWAAVDIGLPLQLHAGYGDPDLDLRRTDPLLLTQWIRAIEPFGTDLILLHCYPFHRNAGFLAQAFPHVYFDVGLALNYAGANSMAIIAESMEIAPFSKILYSSDAWGPPELHYLGALLWRRGMGQIFSRWVADDDLTSADALRICTMIGRTNAERIYGQTP